MPMYMVRTYTQQAGGHDHVHDADLHMSTHTWPSHTSYAMPPWGALRPPPLLQATYMPYILGLA